MIAMATINEVSRLAAGVVPALEAVVEKRAALAREIAALEKAGIVNATPFWNKGRYLYLSYPMKNYDREREYIGTDQARIDEALAKVERFKTHKALSQELSAVDAAFQGAHRALREFFYALDSWKSAKK